MPLPLASRGRLRACFGCERVRGSVSYTDPMRHLSAVFAWDMTRERMGRLMAQKVQVSFVDDLDGSEAEGAVRFGLDGTEYEIDLNAAHAEALREALGKYVEHARKAGSGVSGRRPSRAPRRSRQDSTVVREWAKSQGLEVAERGRVSADVLAKYHEATGN
jgi:hypothetical protein